MEFHALILLLALLPQGHTAAGDPLAGATHVNVNGTTLTYIERGHGGVPVIFVHGSGADLRTWGYQVQSFGASRRAIAYSRRYHFPNKWDGDGRDYGPLLHAADLAAFIRTVADGRVDLVAASYGGERGHPLLAARAVWSGEPDAGLRVLEPRLVPCDDLGEPGDVDTP